MTWWCKNQAGKKKVCFFHFVHNNNNTRLSRFSVIPPLRHVCVMAGIEVVVTDANNNDVAPVAVEEKKVPKWLTPPTKYKKTIEGMLPPEMVGAVLQWVPRELDPLVRGVCRRWHDLLEPSKDDQGQLKKPRRTLLDTACWAALQGDTSLLKAQEVKKGRKRKTADASGCWGAICRALMGAWIDLRWTFHSRAGYGLESQGFRRAGEDLEKLHSRLRSPKRLRMAAIENGNRQVLKVVFPPKHRDPTTEDLRAAIRHGSGKTYLWLDARMRSPRVGSSARSGLRNVLCTEAVWRGRLDIVRIIYAQEYCMFDGMEELLEWSDGLMAVDYEPPVESIPFDDTTKKHFERALYCAHEEIASWFMEMVLRRTDDPMAYHEDPFTEYAAILAFLKGRHRQLRNAKRMYKRHREARFCYAIAARRRDLRALHWLHKHCQAPLDTPIAREVASTGDTEMLQWLVDHDCPFNAAATLEACKWGHLEALIWLWERGCPWHEVQCAHMARGRDDQEMLDWIHKHGKRGTGSEFKRIRRIRERVVRLDPNYGKPPDDDDEDDDDDQGHA